MSDTVTKQDLQEMATRILHEVGRRFDEVETRFNEVETRFSEVETRFNGVETRFNHELTEMAKHILHEVGTRFDASNIQMQDMDRRLRRLDGNMITTMELLTRQTRWHEQSDNAIHDLVKRQAELERRVNDPGNRPDNPGKAS